MTLLDVASGRAVIALDLEEIVTVMNALNEAFEAVEDWEFSTRVGVEKSRAQEIWAELDDARSALEGS